MESDRKTSGSFLTIFCASYLFSKMITYIKLHISFCLFTLFCLNYVYNIFSEIGTDAKFMIWSYSDSFLLYIPLTLSYFELFKQNPSKENFYIACTLKPLEISKLGWAKCHVKQIQVEELGLCAGSLYLYPYHLKKFIILLRE